MLVGSVCSWTVWKYFHPAAVSSDTPLCAGFVRRRFERFEVPAHASWAKTLRKSQTHDSGARRLCVNVRKRLNFIYLYIEFEKVSAL